MAGTQACLTCLLVSLVCACASGPAVERPAAMDAQARPQDVHIEDQRGPLDPRRAAREVDRLDRVDELLGRHLRQVEGVLSESLSLGNEARLLIDGPQTQAAMFRAIAGARRSILLETYIVEADGVGEELAGLLRRKRSEGVDVRLLYDAVGSFATPAAYFDGLKAAGVHVCEFNPVSPLSLSRDPRLSVNNRDHRKILIVDDEVAFTGGINISAVYSSGSFGPFGRRRTSLPDPDAGWRDTHVLVRGPVLTQFRTLFERMWPRQDCQPQALPPAEAPARAGARAMRVLSADPLAGRSEPYLALLSAIELADRRIWLTYGYFVPDEPTVRLLQQAARRGVDVRLVLPGFSDFWAPFHAGRSHYDDLLDAGVRIFERRDALLHAKTAAIDGVWSIVGSTNLDWRSFVHNYEADLLVLDGEFSRELEALFHMDEQASHEILQDEWVRRGLRARFLEWLARRWEYLL